MIRLVKYGLMFGNLVEVRSASLVARYNRALEHLTGKMTELTEFHIDIVGYSPEVGDELGDDLYLNPKGCNQQFILLTTDQKTAPLLNSQFSTSRSILRDFIDENEDQLFALTAREAVTGELLNSVFDIIHPKDLLNINQIQIEADTVQERVAGARELQTKIEDFMTTDDAWWDDVLIAEMIEMAKKTGNIQRNPIALKHKDYAQGNYYTSHFGGMYIFRDVKKPTVITKDSREEFDDMPIETLSFEDRDSIARFLYEHGLVDIIVTEREEDEAVIIRQKLDFIAISTAAQLGVDVSNLSRRDIRQIEREHSDLMPPEFTGLMEIWRWASMGGVYPRLEPEHPAYFYAFRSTRNKDRDLVNMLLSELSPLDFRQLYITHKEAFYETYRGWPESKRDYVSRFLAEEYAMDKVGARETLFGPEPGMADAPGSKSKSSAKTKVQWRREQTRDGTIMVPRYSDGSNLRDDYKWVKKTRKQYKSKGKRRKRDDD